MQTQKKKATRKRSYRRFVFPLDERTEGALRGQIAEENVRLEQKIGGESVPILYEVCEAVLTFLRNGTFRFRLYMQEGAGVIRRVDPRVLRPQRKKAGSATKIKTAN